MEWPKELVDKILSQCFWEDGPLPTLCLIWQGAKTAHGYGLISYRGTQFYTHRIMYEATNSPLLRRLHVLHRCDRPACCNTAHLFLGNQVDNVRDTIVKGRKRQYTKLTITEVKEIKRRIANGVVNSELAREFGVHRATINDIRRGKNWPHI